ncbi:hypothetical protein CEUSTIGMA_g10524.t1 [Chlamydomonas eustigma]|uniref:Uncharacterized protein n=1 Tax=Chlamydomonas eustigma TaxID=1157962 RepID=A0A250XJ44_9CHLO|nr:hypothetical protein CEUSTIGMA_g10524.t1 [Chlamydomonas eustigma]|eukprot:GAX83098.1 hypothetical protein CEUSTIGMA_g10524.t1 [Chlamydomonas eustigma]
MKIGGAVQSLQALQLSTLLIICYLIANPEYTPSPIRPYVSYIRECIAFVFSTIFSGWWPLMAGKIALSVAAVFLSYRLVRVQKEKKEEKHNEDLEKENSERMRRAREEAQRKLQELGSIMQI